MGEHNNKKQWKKKKHIKWKLSLPEWVALADLMPLCF